MRVERVQEKPAPGTLVLDLVVSDAAAADRDFPQRMFVGPYAITPCLGDADS